MGSEQSISMRNNGYSAKSDEYPEKELMINSAVKTNKKVDFLINSSSSSTTRLEAALAKAEEIDGYRERVSKNRYNSYARKGQIYAPSETQLEDTVIELPQSPRWVPHGHIIWMNPSADKGLPHTRPPNLICMPHGFPVTLLKKTLFHERIHLSQRENPDAWNLLIKTAWDMHPYDGALPAVLEERRRLNPDILLAPHFLWKGEYIPFAVFKYLANPSLNETVLCWYHVPTKQVLTDASSIPEWNSFFGSVPDGEHPYEIAAYLMSDTTLSCPAKTVLLQYAESILGVK